MCIYLYTYTHLFICVCGICDMCVSVCVSIAKHQCTIISYYQLLISMLHLFLLIVLLNGSSAVFLTNLFFLLQRQDIQARKFVSSFSS